MKEGGKPRNIVASLLDFLLFVAFRVKFLYLLGCGSAALGLPSSRRRDSTPELAIQVGTPRRGSTQRMSTMYTTKNAMNHSQSGIHFISFLARLFRVPVKVYRRARGTSIAAHLSKSFSEAHSRSILERRV
jgi:hypothetical protein